MSLLSEPVTTAHFLVVGAILFACGITCMAVKRNALGVLMGIELVLNGANLNFLAFANPAFRADPQNALGLDGHLLALFVMVLAAAEAAIALAIALSFYNTFVTVDVDRGNELKG